MEKNVGKNVKKNTAQLVDSRLAGYTQHMYICIRMYIYIYEYLILLNRLSVHLFIL